MHSKIREAALSLGNIDAQPVTGQPFDVWRNQLNKLPLGKYLSFEHDPVKISGWPLEEITIWVAVAPTPPVTGWPDGCGEIGSFYMYSQQRRARQFAWEEAAAALGYEVRHGVLLPERAAAIRAGLGVHGLNGLLITPEYGSFVDITVLMLRAAPPTDARGAEYDLSAGCENCGDCIKACPMSAISENGVDATKCLRSYMNRLDDLPVEDYPKMARRILGCETCQLACPKNKHLKQERPPAEIIDCMKLEELLANPDMDRLLDLIAKYIQLKETNVKSQAVLAAVNTGRKDLLPLVEALIGDENKNLDKLARWAAEQLR